jgi:hypothetical protein
MLAACAAPGRELRLEQAAAPARLIAPGLVPVLEADSATPALALGDDGKRLVGAPLDAVLRWNDPVPASAGAVLAGAIVVAGEGQLLSARAASTGAGFWSIPAPEGILTSAADDGTWTAVGLRVPARGESRVIVYDRRGAPALTIATKERLGAPALTRGRLYLPWGSDALSVIDVASGKELGRIQLPARAERAFAEPRSGVYLLSGQRFVPVSAGPPELIALPARPLPGMPAELLPFSLDPLRGAPGASARSPALIVADPARVRERARHYLYVHERIGLGLSLASAQLEWLYLGPRRVLAAAALERGFLLCDEAGTLVVLGDDGAIDDRIQLSSLPLSGCAVRPGHLRAPGAPPVAPAPLLEQLGGALRVADPALVEVQRFLLKELAGRNEAEATKLLLEIASSATAALTLQRDAGDLLALRRNGVEYMLKALAEDASGGSAPPVRALADALAAMNESRATPLLVEHLNDPSHSSETIAHVTSALEKLAGPDAYEPLRVFFVLHRATADDPDWVQAVVAAARTLLRIGGEPARGLVQLAADDPLTVGEVRGGLARLLATNAPG